ncbi:hypothetical protein VT84_32530 [Gemmata sp. SH-PL17]|uniref:hypothetical protein n=1 Tax=Gemmata sp. SH-PL17 TaxID=1630693 RepID=UPI0004BC8390|nr:hypothetical protein [Gemmata sp. SH-PL17]AMV29167.1 hypothetical protein VT84_32530 [Gemmata sp. SH-PL17]
MTLRSPALFALALCTAALFARPAGASDTPLIAGYWTDFYDHWAGVFQQQNGVVMGALVFGGVCLFIITRGKWRK